MNTAQWVITAVVLFALGGAAAAVLALGDGDSTPPVALAPTSAAVASPSPPPPTPAATDVPPTPAPTEVPALPTPQDAAPLPDRVSCEEIRGTSYRSGAEREFFLANCLVVATAVAQSPSISLPDDLPEIAESCETLIDIETSRVDLTYEVSGSNYAELVASLNANAPQIETGTAFGLTEYTYGIYGDYCRTQTGCSLSAITLGADVAVTLPNLTTFSELDPELAQIWSEYVEQVTLHEERHVRILEEGLVELRRQLLLIGERPDCDALDHEVDKVWILASGQLQQRQNAFHVADALGSGGLVVQ